MRVTVDFQDEALEFDVPDDRLVGAWRGPEGVPDDAVGALVTEALERPGRGFPPLRQAVVPGDGVVIPIDPTVPEPAAILSAMAGALGASGVEPSDILVLASGPAPALAAVARPGGMQLAVHEPDDRTQLAYLATTSGDRRIYLSRHLTDADIVVPIGRLAFDPVLGYSGPWGVIYPGLSNAETRRDFHALASDARPVRGRDRPALSESAEVSWLLGSQFQVGILPGASGVAGVLAGQEDAVRAEGSSALDDAWSFQADERADLVVAGLGAPGRAASIDELAAALDAASRVVRRGGKIVALSRASGPIGPAWQRLAGADDPRSGPAALRGHEGEPDYPAALRIARALAWADVYLLSALPERDVDDLSIIPLGRPEEARRLVASSPSCLFLSQADRVRAGVAGEED